MSFPLLAELHKLAFPSINPAKPKVVDSVIIFGDSLSDQGKPYGMYAKKILGFHLSRFLHSSPDGRFTNGFVWLDAFGKIFKYSRKSSNPLNNPRLAPRGLFKVIENRAQGGATAYNYGGIRGFLNLFLFKYIRAFFLSLVATNMPDEAKKLKKDKSRFNPKEVCIIFGGPNDFITANRCDEDGIDKAIQGIEETIETSKASQYIVFTMPDFSKTPRFYKKSENKRKQAQEVCNSFNKRLRELAKNYQYLNFSLCDIYQVSNKEDVDLKSIKEKGIILTGAGCNRKVYFVENGALIRDEEITTNINLSKTERELLGLEKGKIDRNKLNRVGLESLIDRLSSKAKLNAEVKIFDAAAVFEEIDKNPEAYGFTSGCAVYYLAESQGSEVITQKMISGNAVIIQEINRLYNEKYKGEKNIPVAELLCYFVKDGKLVERGTGSMRLPDLAQFELLQEEKDNLDKKLKWYPVKDGISQLAATEDKHDVWITYIVQQAIQAYEKKFKEKIQLTEIYASVLAAIKKHDSNKELIFWDDLHPSVVVHFLLETVFKQFFTRHYIINSSRVWIDDMAIDIRVSDEVKLPLRAAEAPEANDSGLPRFSPKSRG